MSGINPPKGLDEVRASVEALDAESDPAANVTVIGHAGGVGAATLDDVKAVADKLDAVIDAMVASGLMEAP